MVLAVLCFFFVGLIVGSFINAAEYRLARGESIVQQQNGKAARSHCRECAVELSVIELIPILSFVILRGECRSCKTKISWQYPIVEFATGVVFAAAVFRYGWTAEAAIIAFFGAILVFIFIYDYKYELIVDVVTLPAVVLAFFAGWYLGKDLESLALGTVIGGGFFWLQYFVSRGKWIGGGDIRLGMLMGALLGWQQTIAALFIAYVAGAIVGLFLVARQSIELKSRLPFGTFLSVSTVACLLYGEEIVHWYLNLIV